MPTFTDASLIAAGSGALLWTMLATERTARLRTVIGLLGFVALEAAVLVRYTNVVILAVAVLAALVVFRRAALPLRAVGWWLGSVVALVAGILAFDQVYCISA
jgi:energy-coupling factor transporter transmembrane protein EcfT